MLIMKTCSLFYRTATIYCSIFTSLRLNVGNYQKKTLLIRKRSKTPCLELQRWCNPLENSAFYKIKQCQKCKYDHFITWLEVQRRQQFITCLSLQTDVTGEWYNNWELLRKKIPKRLASQWSSSWTANKSPALGTMHEINYYPVNNLNFCMTG